MNQEKKYKCSVCSVIDYYDLIVEENPKTTAVQQQTMICKSCDHKKTITIKEYEQESSSKVELF